MCFFVFNSDFSVVLVSLAVFVVGCIVIIIGIIVFGVDGKYNLVEGIFYIMTSHSTGFNVVKVVSCSIILGHLSSDFSLVIHVTLVTHQHPYNVLTSPIGYFIYLFV